MVASRAILASIQVVFSHIILVYISKKKKNEYIIFLYGTQATCSKHTSVL